MVDMCLSVILCDGGSRSHCLNNPVLTKDTVHVTVIYSVHLAHLGSKSFTGGCGKIQCWVAQASLSE